MMKRISIAIILLAFLFLIAGCGKDNDKKKTEKTDAEISMQENNDKYQKILKMSEDIEEYLQELEGTVNVENIIQAEDSSGLYINADVLMPPLEDMLITYSSQFNGSDDFYDELFQAVLEEAPSSDTEYLSVYVSLGEIEPDKTDWTDEELTVLAQKAAIDYVMESYCMNVIQQFAPAYPAVEYEEGDAE